jgi:hydroxyacylglutathione hydrolase
VNVIQGIPEGVVLLKYEHRAVAHASYLLIELSTRTATAVDPYGDAERFLQDAWGYRAEVKHVFLTGAYEDLPLAHLDLRARACATVYAGAWNRSHPHLMPVKDGDALEFGAVRLRVLETPGHRLESIVLLASDPREDRPAPFAAFTGKTLLFGDIGRPATRPEDGYDLQEMASMLFDSLTRKILPLPDPTLLLPSHTAELDRHETPPDTIGAEKRGNPGFRPMSRASFTRRVSMDMAGDVVDLPGGKTPRPLSLSEILAGQAGGAILVDDRDPIDFAAGHLAGSVNVSAESAFEPWADRVLDPDRPLLLVSRPGREGATAARLERTGFRTSGFLWEGMRACEGIEEGLLRVRRLSFGDVAPRLEGGAPVLLLDTRSLGRAPEGPAVRAYPVPLERLREELGCLPRGFEIVVCDDSPYRSSAAASLLRLHGFGRVTEVAGGLALWGGGAS